MSPEPHVSVVIPCFNGAQTIGYQLASLERQVDSAPQFEVLVANNRSTDDLAGAVGPFQSRNLLSVRIVEAFGAAGASYARNVGVREAKAEKILFCDSDDIVGSRFVEFGSESLDDVPLFSGAAIATVTEQFPSSIDEAWGMLDEPQACSPPTVRRESEGIPVVMGGAFGMLRSAYIDIGGFDQSFPRSGEDNDFGYRALRAGVSIADSECVRVLYRTSSDDAQRMFKIGNESRARALLVRRYDINPDDVFPGWRFAVPRAIAAALKSTVLRSGPDVDRAIRERWVASTRFVRAMATYSRRERQPEPRIGLGLRPGD